MPAVLSNWMPSATTRPPIQAASTGLWAWPATVPTAWAVAVGSVIACGVRITNTASTFLSFSTISTALAKRSGGASPSTSTGLPCDQQIGNNSLSFSIVSSLIWANSPSRSIRASVVITPGPPALVMIASRSPLGGCCRAKSSAQSNMSSIWKIRSMPAR